jgi:hypothetical protein
MMSGRKVADEFGYERAREVLADLFGLELPDVLELISYLRAEKDFAVVAGSVAVGLGNQASDLDVIVAGGAQESSAALPLTHFLGKARVDVWRLDIARLEELAERGRAALAERAPIQATLTESDIRILQRLAFGLVIDGQPSELLSSPTARSVVCALCERHFAEAASRAAVIAHFCRQDLDMVGAAWSARRGLDAAGEARLARSGRPLIGAKWLYHRLRDHDGEWWADVAAYTVLPESFAEQCVQGYVGRCLDKAGAALGLDLGYDALAARFEWKARASRYQKLGDKHLLLDLKQYRLIEVTSDEAGWWQELAELGASGSGALLADTPAERLAFLRSLLRHSFAELRPAIPGDAS